MILLTSFKKSVDLEGFDCFSVARSSPRGFSYPQLKFFIPFDVFGNKIELIENVGSRVEILERYEVSYNNTLLANKHEIDSWVELVGNRNIALCCWCPYSNIAESYMKRHDGFFACHTGLIEIFLKENYKEIEVILDEDRSSFLIDSWVYGNRRKVVYE